MKSSMTNPSNGVNIGNDSIQSVLLLTTKRQWQVLLVLMKMTIDSIIGIIIIDGSQWPVVLMTTMT